MNVPISQSLYAMFGILCFLALGCLFLWKGVDFLADLLNVKNVGDEEESFLEKKETNTKKYFTLKNYLIVLATIATIGILIIAIKLL